MDPIKEAFSRIKEDILFLQEQIITINQQIEEIKRTLEEKKEGTTAQKQDNQTIQQINPTQNQTPTDNLPYKPLKSSISAISTGNDGVPTDRQTDRQTNQHIPENNEKLGKIDRINQIRRVSEVLESLDSIKKELRTNFKQLTSQEMAVFSIIYNLEEQGFVVDYSLISQKLGLSESSIRDYIHKIIKKGVPLIKIKENNKKVTLSISPDLKKIASLQTILSLRNL